jgi:hypothetical protein
MICALDPAKPAPYIIERAFHLADSGEFASVEDIAKHLLAEHYDSHDVFLNFECRAATRADLLRRCRRARLSVPHEITSEGRGVEQTTRLNGVSPKSSLRPFLRLPRLGENR